MANTLRKSALLENNDTEYVRTNDDKGIGIRIIKDGTWGFFSITNPQSFEEIKNALENSVKNIINSTENKKKTIELYPNISKKTNPYRKVLTITIFTAVASNCLYRRSSPAPANTTASARLPTTDRARRMLT